MAEKINEIKTWFENIQKQDSNQYQKDAKNNLMINLNHIQYLISEKQDLRAAYDTAIFNESLAKQKLNKKLETKIEQLNISLELVNKEIINERSDIETALTILKRTSLDTQYLKYKVNELTHIIAEIENKTESTEQIKFYEEKQFNIEHKSLNNTKDQLVGKLLNRESFKSAKSPLHIKSKELRDSVIKQKEDRDKNQKEQEENKVHEAHFKQFNDHFNKNSKKNRKSLQVDTKDDLYTKIVNTFKEKYFDKQTTDECTGEDSTTTRKFLRESNSSQFLFMLKEKQQKVKLK